MAGHCTSWVRHKLVDGTYLTLECTRPFGHVEDHMAVWYWSLEIEDEEDK